MKDALPIVTAFDRVRAGLTLNKTVQGLANSPAAFSHVMDHIQDHMGLHRLVPMTDKSADAMMSLVFYAGDGVVLKVDSSNFLPQAGPFEVPPITSERITGRDRFTDRYYDFTVSTYPFLSRHVNQSQIETFEREQLLPIGLKISADDKHPRNFRAAPDTRGTILSIDTGSYTSAYNGNFPTQDTKDEFYAYMRLMFPAYDDPNIARQGPDTSFAPFSPFDPKHLVTSFDVRRCLDAGESAIELAQVHEITTPEKPIRPFWRKLLLPFSNSENTVNAQTSEGSEPA